MERGVKDRRSISHSGRCNADDARRFECSRYERGLAGNDGSGAANRFGDLWLLTIDVASSSATWTELTPGGSEPPAQSATCLAYDPAGRRLIVHGGGTQDGENAGTTHQYLLDDDLWQLDATTGTSPGSRSFAGCAWDPSVGRAVLYGGQGSSTSPIDRIFTYDLDTRA